MNICRVFMIDFSSHMLTSGAAMGEHGERPPEIEKIVVEK